MIRAVDLRYRKIKQGSLDVFSLFFEKAEKSIQDLLALDISPKIDPAFYNEDICNISHKLKQFQRKIDFLITSPPYLNGTNYDRNTKLEMGFLEMIKTDMDLRELRTKMVIAGINSTRSKNKYNLNLTFWMI